MIGADVLLVSRPASRSTPRCRAGPPRRPARVAQTVTFPSMATARTSGVPAGAPQSGEAPSQLGALKAVTDGYPLRGRLKVLPPAAARSRKPRAFPRRARSGRIRRCWMASACAWATASTRQQDLPHRARDHAGTRPWRGLHELRAARDAAAVRPRRHQADRLGQPCDLPPARWPARTPAPPPTSAGRLTRSNGATCATRAWNRSTPASRRCAPRWTAPSASCRWWQCCRR